MLQSIAIVDNRYRRYSANSYSCQRLMMQKAQTAQKFALKKKKKRTPSNESRLK